MKSRKVIGIMACDPSGVIGKANLIPWDFASEFDHFNRTVKGGTLIMGRKTMESLPKSLLDRHKYFVFSKKNYAGFYKIQKNATQSIFISSIEEFINLDISQNSILFMIGGAEIAHLFIKHNLISEFILTMMHKIYEGDTNLNLRLLENWNKVVVASCEDYTIYKFLPI